MPKYLAHLFHGFVVGLGDSFSLMLAICIPCICNWKERSRMVQKSKAALVCHGCNWRDFQVLGGLSFMLSHLTIFA